MKKILCVLLLICVIGMPLSKNAFAENKAYVKALFSSVNVFMDKNINADFNQDGENLDIILTIKYGDKLELLTQDVQTGEDGFNYYQVKINENLSGYVLYSNVLLSSISSPKKDLDFNATTNKKTIVYIYENGRLQEDPNTTLLAGEKIKILEMGTNGYSRIQYKDLDGDILTVYVKTADIQTSGISRGLIGAIIIIVTTISLVLVVFGIKGNRKRKQKRLK